MTASSTRMRASIAPSHRTRLFALFGVLALLAMVALSAWHDALPHVDSVEQSVGVDADHHHDGGSSDQPDAADLIHVAAHMVVQSVDVPASPILAFKIAPVAMRWGLSLSPGIGSVQPDSLLRPPRG